jgi:hypothetical protein
MTELKPGETRIKDQVRKKRQREQLENAFKRYQQSQAQQISVLPVIPQIVEPESPSMLMAILAPSFASSSLCGIDSATAASSDQHAESPSGLSPPSPTSEGTTTPTDSLHSILTLVSQDGMHLGFMPGGINEKGISMVSPDRSEAYHSLPNTPTKRSAPSEFNEDINSIQGRSRTGPHIPSTCEDFTWSQGKPAPALVHEAENWNPSISTTSLTAIEEELEPAQRELLNHKRTISEVEDEIEVPRGFINFIKYTLTKSRQSAHSMLSASGTIRSRFSSRVSLPQSNIDTAPPENTGSSLPHMSNWNTYISTSQLGMSYEIERQSEILFLELQRPLVSDNSVAAKVLEHLQNLGSAQASSVVNARNPLRETPLEVALALGNVPACEALLEAGADVYARTSTGKCLAEFARIAEKEVKNCTHYAAIGICKNRILDYPLSQKDTRSRKAKNSKSDSKPRASSQMASEKRLVRQARGPSHSTSNLSPYFAPAPEMTQEESTPLGIGHTAHQSLLREEYEGMHSSEFNSVSSPLVTITPYPPIPVSISPRQAPLPDVPDLRPFWSPPPRTDSVGWKTQGLQSLPTDPSQTLASNAIPWTESSPSMESLSLAQLRANSATSHMFTTAANNSLSSGIVAPEFPPDNHFGCYDCLPNGRRVYISLSSHSLIETGRQFSHRDARVIETANSVHLHYPMVTQIDPPVPNVQTALTQEPWLAPNIDIYANMANEALYSNVSHQPNRFFDTKFQTNTLDPLPNPPPNSNSVTYAFSPTQQTPQASTPFINHTLTTWQPQNHTPSLASQPPNHSAMDFEAPFSTTMNSCHSQDCDPYCSCP